MMATQPHQLGLQSALLIDRHVLFTSHKYQLEFINSRLAGFELGSPRPKALCYAPAIFQKFQFKFSRARHFHFLLDENEPPSCGG